MFPRVDNVTCHVLISAAIIVTGGLRDGDYVTEVEVLRGDGSAWCRLPAAPPTSGHTQSGLELCGGSSCFSSCCYQLEAGAWLTSHTLNHARHDHSAWRSPGGLLLLGGPSMDTTELLSASSQDSTDSWPPRHSTGWVPGTSVSSPWCWPGTAAASSWRSAWW